MHQAAINHLQRLAQATPKTHPDYLNLDLTLSNTQKLSTLLKVSVVEAKQTERFWDSSPHLWDVCTAGFVY